MIQITAQEYDALRKAALAAEDAYEDLLWLSCLEGAGVDNWEGYEYARQMYREQSK